MKQIEKTTRTLEFDKVKAMLASCAATAGAKKLAIELDVSTSPHTVTARQRRTADAKYLVTIKGHPSFGLVTDPSECCERAEKGSALSPK